MVTPIVFKDEGQLLTQILLQSISFSVVVLHELFFIQKIHNEFIIDDLFCSYNVVDMLLLQDGPVIILGKLLGFLASPQIQRNALCTMPCGASILHLLGCMCSAPSISMTSISKERPASTALRAIHRIHCVHLLGESSWVVASLLPNDAILFLLLQEGPRVNKVGIHFPLQVVFFPWLQL